MEVHHQPALAGAGAGATTSTARRLGVWWSPASSGSSITAERVTQLASAPRALLSRDRPKVRRSRKDFHSRPTPKARGLKHRPKLNKHLAEICFLEQGFVKDPNLKVSKVLEELGKEVGGKMTISDYLYFKVGEAAS
jgi:hypothetical protein